MVDQAQGRAGEASAPIPPTRRMGPDQDASDCPPATDTTPTPAEQAQINQDEALNSGEENVV